MFLRKIKGVKIMNYMSNFKQIRKRNICFDESSVLTLFYVFEALCFFAVAVANLSKFGLQFQCTQKQSLNS